MAVIGVGALLLVHMVRICTTVGFRWWIPLAIVTAGAAADLVSGVVHWLADTWGRDSMPVIGERFLRPFRVHHVNPDDLLRRDFIDCNGDVAMLTLLVLAPALWISLDTEAGRIAEIWTVAFVAWTLPTNQIHQWAHMPDPPRLVRWLQQHAVILSPEAHARHHVSPYAVNYCIATGWCNRLLTRVDFFRALERAVTRLTGQRPRADDVRFAHRSAGSSRAAVRPPRRRKRLRSRV
jgi:ubiquitin-conjugating enzyme E2 variant